jgi:type I restriction enzyme R subunit
MVKSATSRENLRELLRGRNSGGVFLTTIHKFTEDTELLTDRSNVICISDEAHRSQVNLDQKVRVTKEGVQKTFGFAKYLHESLPNATYVGFTGTPIDATFDVFGPIVDAYTMTESVEDQITVPIVYEGRAAKVLLDSQKLDEIEDYYSRCAAEGANEYQIEESKKAMAQMRMILGDPQRLQAVAEDLVAHYEKRLTEGATVAGKAMIVCSSREIAYDLYQRLTTLRPEWKAVKAYAEGAILTEKDKRELKPMAYLQMVMTRTKDDKTKRPEMYKALGDKAYRTELDRQFKKKNSNFKLAIVVDMWLTGFDVPFLDTMYIDKPIKRHTLIQTISRVNRTYAGKTKGLVVDYIGIKKQMNLALAIFNKTDLDNFEDIKASLVVVRDHLDLLKRLFHGFDESPYFDGPPIAQLHTLNMGAEFVQQLQKREQRFMGLMKRLKAAYDICAGSDELQQIERDYVHFYLAIRSIVFKMTRGTAPDTTQMNARVRRMIEEALKSDGVEEIFKMGDDKATQINLFEPEYLARIRKIKLPHTKIKLLQKLLAKAITDFRRTNRMQGIEFSRKFQRLVDRYNERRDQDILKSEVLEDFTDELFRMIEQLHNEVHSFEDMGIDFEEKAFYDILKAIRDKYEFEYPEEKLIAWPAK